MWRRERQQMKVSASMKACRAIGIHPNRKFKMCILAEYNPKKYTNPLAFLDNMIIFAPEIQRLTSWLKKKSYSRS